MGSNEDAVPLRAVTPRTLLAEMPEHLRPVAAGKAKVPPDVLAAAWRAADEQDRALAEQRREAQRAGRARVWERCLTEAYKYRDASLSQMTADQDPQGRIAAWLDRGEDARQLLLAGPPRRGKTWAAYAVGNEARRRDWFVTAWTVQGLQQALSPSSDRGDAALAEVLSARLLILDDLGRERATEWMVSHLHHIVETRLKGAVRTEEGLAPTRTIFTTNLSYTGFKLDEKTGEMVRVGPDGIVQVYGDPFADRLTEDCTIVKIEGQMMSAPTPW